MAGQGQDGTQRSSWWRPGRWGWLLIYVGAAAFLSMTELGHVAAVLAMISVIGIPIYFLLAALPSIFLILLFLRFVVGAAQNFRAGHAAWGLAFGAAALCMVDYFVLRAQRANTTLDARAAALTSADTTASGRIAAGLTLATVRLERSFGRAKPEDVCDDLCQRLLLNGFAKRVLVATLVSTRPARGGDVTVPPLEPAPDLAGVMYWLEKRPVCPDVKVPDSLRTLRVDDPASGVRRADSRSVSQTMRVTQAGGLCLISAPARLDEADGAFFYGHIAFGGGLAYGFDIGKNTIDAWRTAYFRRAGANWVNEHRATGVRYQRFPGALIPSYIHGQELRIYNGYLRSAHYAGPRQRYSDDAPVAETLAALGVNLRIDEIAPSVAAAKIVDDILAGRDALTGLQKSILDDYLGRFTFSRGQLIPPDDVRRIMAIAADERAPFAGNAQGAVTVVAQQQPQLAPDLARMLFVRLDAIVANASIVSDQASRSAGSLSGALSSLPAAALRPYFASIEAASRAPGLRQATAVLVARLDIFGAFAVPAMFRVMDDALAERAPGRSDWRPGFSAGLRALCRLGGEGAFARSMLEDRIRRDGDAFISSHDRLLIATLVRMGASEAEIVELLGFDEKKQSRLSSAMRAARGQRACD
jgi:hypothetical protein